MATAYSATICVGGEGRGPGDPILGLEQSELPRHFACKDTGRLGPMKLGKVNPEPKLVECTVRNKDKSPLHTEVTPPLVLDWKPRGSALGPPGVVGTVAAPSRHPPGGRAGNRVWRVLQLLGLTMRECP